jgi:protein-S-isoprenylcysteine O-methyltransferase Ste14
MRGFFALLMVLGGIAATIFMFMAFSAADSAIHEIEALIAALIIMVAVAAGYLGGVIDDQFNRIWPPMPPQQQQPVYPPVYPPQQ